MNNKAVVFICGNADSLVRFRSEFVSEFQSRGYSVTVFSGEVSPFFKLKLTQMDVKYEEIRLNRKSVNLFDSLFSIIDIIKKLKKVSPEFVFSFTHKSVVIGSICAYFSRVPKIFSMITGTGHIFDNNTFKEKLRRFIGFSGFRFSLRLNKKVFFQNPDDLNLFLQYKLVQENSCIRVNGSGVNLDLFKIEALPDKPIFLCMSRLIKSKGLIEYAEAAKILKIKYPDAEFLLAGFPDDHEDSISEDEIKNNWLNDFGIKYIGLSTNPIQTIASCSAYVLLSYNEGTPRSVLEAMAMGRAIITTDVPGCRETVLDDTSGYLVRVRDPESAAGGMEKLMNSEKRTTMGKESRHFCERKFDVKNVNLILINSMFDIHPNI